MALAACTSCEPLHSIGFLMVIRNPPKAFASRMRYRSSLAAALAVGYEQTRNLRYRRTIRRLSGLVMEKRIAGTFHRRPIGFHRAHRIGKIGVRAEGIGLEHVVVAIAAGISRHAEMPGAFVFFLVVGRLRQRRRIRRARG